jgi:probable rRNA maturation factor
MQARSTSKDGQDFAISLANEQSRHAVNEQSLIDAARAVLRKSDFRSANVSLAVVDDAKIHELNRRHLNHDWPTDVLSFVLDDDGNHLEGEVIISADTAAATAAEVGAAAVAEQVLYVIHGMLHLVGHDDTTADDRRTMRAAEAELLRSLGWESPRGFDDETCGSASVAASNVHPGTTAP